jgi:GAF domain-containing protein
VELAEVRTRGRDWWTLGLEATGPADRLRGSDEPFAGTEMEIAQAMAEMAAIGLIQERALRERNLLTEQLQAALNSQVVIEQANGGDRRVPDP